MKSHNVMRMLSTILFSLYFSSIANANNGHDLWLAPKAATKVTVVCENDSPMLALAQKELKDGWQGKANAIVTLSLVDNPEIKDGGYSISPSEIQATTEAGVLYGVYDYLRRQYTNQSIDSQTCNPSYQHRVLNHWDNPDGSVERGYAGKSLFWRSGEEALITTDADRKRWHEYARANASIGINGSVLNNVNASPMVIEEDMLMRVKDIADIFRQYGLKTYLSIKFSSPQMIGGLDTSDPLDPEVINWWNQKVEEIYRVIPDFGGFLVKASSEGQPGPQDFGRNHAEGANMLADALKPYHGIVMWRAFVYQSNDEDRAKQAYNEFMPLDGQFRDNVIIQTKNGPIDFQPREPFSPLFGAMKKTSIMPELQITQEYLGRSIHLAYLAPMWEEFLKSETYQEGIGSTVAACTDGSLFPQQHTAIAGVSNLGNDENWCGHLFAQSNWYAFGRLAWNHRLSSEQIASEWLKLTFSPEASADPAIWNSMTSDWYLIFFVPVKQLMMDSREAVVNYMMPLGLHHIFSANGHYGPGPWWGPEGVRRDWTPPYYHNASKTGVGFDRTPSGSDATRQYHEVLSKQLNDPSTCPDAFLLWFHHLPWDYEMKSGNTLWDEMCYKYDSGLKDAREFEAVWNQVEAFVDEERFVHVQQKLKAQAENALLWKDACIQYFQTFSEMAVPSDIEPMTHALEDIIRDEFKVRYH